MMHGYFGTCIGGQKTHLFPIPVACRRRFGPACLALYVPRRNGRLNAGYMLREYRWAAAQKSLFGAYAGVVTASRHMRDEFARNGVPFEKLHPIPLFSTLPVDPAPPPEAFSVLFLGRMTALKGGDLLIRAAAHARTAGGPPIRVVMAGDGPQLEAWAGLAASLRVDADFQGWVDEEHKVELLRAASLLVVPSVWPEPFGLVGLEAASQGVPAIAYAVGGVDEWLKAGSGILLPGDPPRVDTLGEALAHLAAHPGELAAMRPRAAEVARAMSLDAHVDKLEAVLEAAARTGTTTTGVGG